MLLARITLVVSGILGVVGAFIGAYHGYGEILQGNDTPRGIMINAFGGPNCPPQGTANCFPAMTILPTAFMVVGILTVVVAIVTLAAAIMSAMGKTRGLALLVASIILLLVGGGFLAPILGIVGAIFGHIGTRAKKEATPAATQT